MEKGEAFSQEIPDNINLDCTIDRGLDSVWFLCHLLGLGTGSLALLSLFFIVPSVQ